MAGIDVYTDTNVHKPLTLVACPPKHSPDDDEFTESVSDMEARILGQIEEERKAQWEGRVGRGKPQEGETDVMDTTTAAGDPSAIPGTNLHVVPPRGIYHGTLSSGGAAYCGSHQCSRRCGCRCEPGAPGRSAAGRGRVAGESKSVTKSWLAN